mmetsp:Transcript_18864/g.37048  ORF Transcript_18864/g.37048 Transcript_18864/m.37048 type:complete len:219 (+) Transcript_18864:738-1394(+)
MRSPSHSTEKTEKLSRLALCLRTSRRGSPLDAWTFLRDSERLTKRWRSSSLWRRCPSLRLSRPPSDVRPLPTSLCRSLWAVLSRTGVCSRSLMELTHTCLDPMRWTTATLILMQRSSQSLSSALRRTPSLRSPSSLKSPVSVSLPMFVCTKVRLSAECSFATLPPERRSSSRESFACTPRRWRTSRQLDLVRLQPFSELSAAQEILSAMLTSRTLTPP